MTPNTFLLDKYTITTITIIKKNMFKKNRYTISTVFKLKITKIPCYSSPIANITG